MFIAFLGVNCFFLPAFNVMKRNNTSKCAKFTNRIIPCPKIRLQEERRGGMYI